MLQALQQEDHVLCNRKLWTDLLTLHLQQNFHQDALSIHSILLGTS